MTRRKFFTGRFGFTFSPLVEQTAADTVVLDIAGQDLLFGAAKGLMKSTNHEEIISARNLASEIARRARQLKLEMDVAVARIRTRDSCGPRLQRRSRLSPTGDEGLQSGSTFISKIQLFVGWNRTVQRAEEIQETFIAVGSSHVWLIWPGCRCRESPKGWARTACGCKSSRKEKQIVI